MRYLVGLWMLLMWWGLTRVATESLPEPHRSIVGGVMKVMFACMFAAIVIGGLIIIYSPIATTIRSIRKSRSDGNKSIVAQKRNGDPLAIDGLPTRDIYEVWRNYQTNPHGWLDRDVALSGTENQERGPGASRAG